MKNGYQISILENIKVLASKSSNRSLYSATGNVISTTTQENNLAKLVNLNGHIHFNLAISLPRIYVYICTYVYVIYIYIFMKGIIIVGGNE